MEAFWLAVTNLGRDEVFIVVLSLYTWLVAPRGGRDLGVAFALSYLTNTALKFGFDLPRPFTADPAVASAAAKATGLGPGLPSGHTQMSMTLWGGMAAQLRRPVLSAFAAFIIALVAYSRLALHVHYLADVGVGLSVGAFFVLLAARGHFAQAGAERWLIPIGLLLLVLALPAGTPREYPVALGLLAGFWGVRPRFEVPKGWGTRLTVALLGLLIVFGCYFGLSVLLHGLSDIPVVRALRYALVVWVAAEGVPLLLRRLLERLP